MTSPSTRFHPWIAAVYDHLNVYFEHSQAPPHREYLATDLAGRVLEIGPGTGAMFPYYAAHGHPSASYHGAEPDPAMRRQARLTAAEAGLEVSLTGARAESLPYADDSFDALVSSCVFCSLPDVERALDEIARVVADSGEFRFFEHVRSDGWLGRGQAALTPVWRRFGGNCHLDRELAPLLLEHDRFEVTNAAKYSVGHYPIRLFLRGTASVRG